MDEIVRQRNHLALLLFRRTRRVVPLEELVSAGNLGIAMAIHKYVPGQGRSIVSFCNHKMHWEMLHAIRTEMHALEEPIILHPPLYNTGYVRCILSDVLGRIESLWGKENLHLFELAAVGWKVAELSRHLRIPFGTIGTRMRRVRMSLR